MYVNGSNVKYDPEKDWIMVKVNDEWINGAYVGANVADLLTVSENGSPSASTAWQTYYSASRAFYDEDGLWCSKPGQSESWVRFIFSNNVTAKYIKIRFCTNDGYFIAVNATAKLQYTTNGGQSWVDIESRLFTAEEMQNAITIPFPEPTVINGIRCLFPGTNRNLSCRDGNTSGVQRFELYGVIK